MFKFKTAKQRLQDERRKNEILNAKLIDIMNAIIELADLAATQDDALIELAEMTAATTAESEANT